MRWPGPLSRPSRSRRNGASIRAKSAASLERAASAGRTACATAGLSHMMARNELRLLKGRIRPIGARLAADAVSWLSDTFFYLGWLVAATIGLQPSWQLLLEPIVGTEASWPSRIDECERPFR